MYLRRDGVMFTSLSPIPPDYSSKYNSDDAEVTYQSSDDTRFRVHAIYLQTHTGGLDPPTEMNMEEVVYLTESSKVLDALFDFIYPVSKSHLMEQLSSQPGFLMEVAEAAEKYQVFPAMSACVLIMRDTLPKAALPILAHALKHNHTPLANEAAPHTLDEAPANVIAAISSDYHLTWLKYHQSWVDLQKDMLTSHISKHNPDLMIVSQIAKSLRYLPDVAASLKNSSLHSEWGEQILARIGRLQSLMDHSTRRSFTDSSSEPDHQERPFFMSDCLDKDLITLKSLDGWESDISREVLVKCAPGFNDILPSSGEGSVYLLEDGYILEIIVGFLRPTVSPSVDLQHGEATYLLDLAYAFEKYKVYYGMSLCKYFIQKRVKDHPSDIFVYAAKFGYRDILNEAAPLVITNRNTFSLIIRQIPSETQSAWALYYQRWVQSCFDVVKVVIEHFSGNEGCYCPACKKMRRAGETSFFEIYATPAIELLMEGPHNLGRLDTTLRNIDTPDQWPMCPVRESSIEAVNTDVQSYLRKIGRFSSFL